ncbi:CDP-alcohol phosphatidyltransferase family protein [Actinopolymorpha sp. B17G11]|uniref:CDP-alcohol phosphatidyltransferase family protein n=1 Tax=unclassified Actinopolymorpha TaxID=2627063 RepID=UPI0032D944CF
MRVGSVASGTHAYRRDLVTAAVAEAVLLTLLWAYLGLGLAGWVAGIAFTVFGGLVLGAAFRRSGTWSLSPADRVTLTRLTLIGGITAIAADRIGGSAPAVMVALATVALILDGVDGRVARRTGTASEFGARFDIEADSFLVLVLSIFVAPSLGAWVLAIGCMRYAYVAASWRQPWLRTPLRPLYARKVVAVIQGVVLVVVSADLLPRSVEFAVVALALFLLICSFGESVWWQWRHGRNLAA